jgi:hypothetical protein
MKTLHWGCAMAALAAIGLVVGFGSTPARAQPGAKQASAKIPDTFGYEIVGGRRVPRGKRVTAADGSWREEIRDGACVTIKEQSAAGEYRETRKCD